MRWVVEHRAGLMSEGWKVRRVLLVWQWRAWPHANAGREDYFLARGWAVTRERARRAAKQAVGL